MNVYICVLSDPPRRAITGCHNKGAPLCTKDRNIIVYNENSEIYIPFDGLMRSDRPIDEADVCQ